MIIQSSIERCLYNGYDPHFMKIEIEQQQKNLACSLSQKSLK